MNIGPAVESFAKNVGFKDAKKGRAILIGGTAILIVGIIGFSIYKWRKRKNALRYDVLDANKELGNIGVSSSNLTLSEGKAILISQNLLNAMNRVGTDEAAIIDNLNNCKTADDLKLVIQKFGTKSYATGVLAEGFISRYTGQMKNLNGWLRSELSGMSLSRVKEIYDRVGVPF